MEYLTEEQLSKEEVRKVLSERNSGKGSFNTVLTPYQAQQLKGAVETSTAATKLSSPGFIRVKRSA